MNRLIALLLGGLLLFSAPAPVSAMDSCGSPCHFEYDQKEYQTREEKWAAAVTSMSSQEIWAHVVSGEAGGLADGAELVAWTLRAWQVYRGMPADQAGPEWGWYGWSTPSDVSWAAVKSAWNQPMSAAPYEWMRAGKFCQLLGTDTDVRYWRSLGWEVTPHFRLEWPEWKLSMNCIWN